MENSLSKVSSFYKKFGWYSFIVGLISVIWGIYVINLTSISLGLISYFLVSGLGIVSGICLLKKISIGWWLAFLWSFLQILQIQTSSFVLNFQQLLTLSFKLSLPGLIITLNFVGIILIVLLIKNKDNL